MGKKARKELQDPEIFEGLLREEISISAEFDLPLSVLALRVDGCWSQEATRRALDALRTADLVSSPDPAELLVALPNTRAREARVVEERLRGAVPEALVGVASYSTGDSAEDLLKHARTAVPEQH